MYCKKQRQTYGFIQASTSVPQALARTVLEDSIRFFWDLDQCAKWRDISPWELFEEVAPLLKAVQALTHYQGGHTRHVMEDPAETEEKEVDIRLNFMRPERLRSAYGRGPGYLVTKTGLGTGWDDAGSGRCFVSLGSCSKGCIAFQLRLGFVLGTRSCLQEP
ncbi:unnamed protein product [Symbiodinium sp. KB8]|nr:unnamed protein product [Symbiodinium sp. KB8]